jgi:signal transduction histidine kinase
VLYATLGCDDDMKMLVHVQMQIRSLWRLTFMTASPLRALVEATVVSLIVGAAVMLLDVSPFVKGQGLFFFVQPVAVLWYSLRLRRLPFSRLRQLLLEGFLIIALSVGLLVVPLVYWPFIPTAVATRGEDWLGFFFSVLMNGFVTFIAAVVLRGGLCLGLLWDRWRRTRLVWALTHAHLTVVVIVALIFVLLVTLNLSQSRFPGPIETEQPSPTASFLARLFVSILPIAGFLVVLSAVALLAVVPPSALFSYWFARRTTRRLESLTRVTTALRSGHYAARVRVEGEDEVAHLQADFNGMADELERALSELKMERDRVTELLAQRRQWVAAVSHELRTPVATLRGYLESTQTRTIDGELSPDLAHDLAVMDRETARLQALVEDLFTLSRAEVNGLALQLKPTDVAAVARRCADAYAPLAWQMGRVEVVAECPASVRQALVDESRLEQILYNLLRNGVQHTPPGGIVVVSVSEESKQGVLQVKDTGEGIAAEDLPHVWERFYRAPSVLSQNHTGAGLGLAIVKELTESMGGQVEVESQPSHGSCFTVRLPLGPC